MKIKGSVLKGCCEGIQALLQVKDFGLAGLQFRNPGIALGQGLSQLLDFIILLGFEFLQPFDGQQAEGGITY